MLSLVILAAVSILPLAFALLVFLEWRAKKGRAMLTSS
jgi:hypothetical protein